MGISEGLTSCAGSEMFRSPVRKELRSERNDHYPIQAMSLHLDSQDIGSPTWWSRSRRGRHSFGYFGHDRTVLSLHRDVASLQVPECATNFG